MHRHGVIAQHPENRGRLPGGLAGVAGDDELALGNISKGLLHALTKRDIDGSLYVPSREILGFGCRFCGFAPFRGGFGIGESDLVVRVGVSATSAALKVGFDGVQQHGFETCARVGQLGGGSRRSYFS